MQKPRGNPSWGSEIEIRSDHFFGPFFTFLAKVAAISFSCRFQPRGCVHRFLNVKRDFERTTYMLLK